MVLVIFFLALFPFDFSIRATAFRREGLFLDWFAPVAKQWPGWLMNVLFFFPFGVAWSWWNRAKKRRWLSSWVMAGLVGLMLSFIVEFLQLYVPQRDSSWDDVVTNTLGALAGWLFFRYWGAACLCFVESAMDDLSTILER